MPIRRLMKSGKMRMVRSGKRTSRELKKMESTKKMMVRVRVRMRLLSIAEETLAEFLAKATGTVVDWVQMPRMKPGPDSIGIVAISHRCSGVAARVCGLVSLGPTKAATMFKVMKNESPPIPDTLAPEGF